VHAQTVNSWPKPGHEYVKILSFVPIGMCPLDTFWKTRDSTVAAQCPGEQLTFK